MTRRPTFCGPRRTFYHVLSCLTLGAMATAIPSTALDYPGPDPGKARAEIRNDRLSVGNNALLVTWSFKGEKLTPAEIRNQLTGQVIQLKGEVFQIVLTDGTRYPASALLRDGQASVSEVQTDQRSARLAGQIPGRQVLVPLRSADGALRVLWQAEMQDNGNYVRQEIQLTAAMKDLALSEIIWLDQVIPGAATAGRVDGSPLVAGDLFFGSEDPHARNEVQTKRGEIGAWVPTDLEAGTRRRKSWSLSANALQEGTNLVVFQYTKGPHRLDVWQVALLEDGREVSRDGHHGRTGNEHVENAFSLPLDRVKPGARYELVAEIGTDPGLELPAGREVQSFGQLFLLGQGGPVQCRLPRNAVLRRGQTLAQSFVFGVAPSGQLRRAFLYYLERERAHPYRAFLHYNSWYDTAWEPFALNETNCLEAIRLCGERLIKPHGVMMDAMVFDDGWDNPKSLWQFHAGFPRGFAPLADACKEYGTRPGVWLSPFGGYGEPKKQRLKFGREQGFEINDTGFSMAGPKYYDAFKRACVGMIREFGVKHFKFDGIAAGMYANGSDRYILDTEAMRRLMLELRHEDPNVYINLTTGSWPSPFWLRYADSLWRQGHDMGHAGKGGKQQQWITYRDQETYSNVVRKGPLYPLNSLMTQGVAYSKHGLAGDRTFNSAGFKDDVRAFFGSGTGLQELYIQPSRLTASDWAVLAEAARWSRANQDVLVDTHWIGGNPAQSEVYGWASWAPRKGIVTLRNPDDQPHEFMLDVAKVFELPADAARNFRLKSPWAADATQAELRAQAGEQLRLVLQPFEIIVLEATSLP